LALVTVIALVFTTGSWLSKQALEATSLNTTGPIVLDEYAKTFAQPVLVAQSPQPPREAVLEIAHWPTDGALKSSPDLSHTSRVLSMAPISRFETPSNANFGMSAMTQLESPPAAMRDISSRSFIPQSLISSPPSADGMTFSFRNVESASAQDPAFMADSSQANPFVELLRRPRLSRPYVTELRDNQANLYLAQDLSAGSIFKITHDGQTVLLRQGLRRPRGLAFDASGNLYILESGLGRILRVEPMNGEITPQSPISVFAYGFSPVATVDRSDPERESELGPSYLLINQSGDLLIGDATAAGTVIYKISPKQPTPWWKFFCWYRC
jgi:hypothetical protein